MSNRRNEIEAKKAKILELRRRRESARAGGLDGSPGATPSPSSASTSVDELVNSLVGGVQPVADAQREAPRHEQPPADSQPVKLTVASLPIFDIPLHRKQVVTYSKSVQTDTHDTSLAENIASSSYTKSESQALEAPAETEKEEAPFKVLKSNEESQLITDSVNAFIDQSLRVIGRATESDYDIMKNYSKSETNGEASSQQPGFLSGPLKETDQFVIDGDRAVTALDWSPHYQELLISSYSALPTSKGLANIWNLHSRSAPEYSVHAFSTILDIKFAKSDPQLVYGTTYNGQVLMWDMRSPDGNPVLSSPITASSRGGHSYPVYSLQFLGSNYITTASTDGTVCVWTTDMLAKPEQCFALKSPEPPSSTRNDDVSPTALLTTTSTSHFLFGSEDGTIYQCNRFDQAGSKSGIDPRMKFEGHSSFVTSLHLNPFIPDLFISSSLDWSVRLWRYSVPPKDALVDISLSDSVFDVRWNPKYPSVFASVDGTGQVSVWDLLKSSDTPVATSFTKNKADEDMDSRPLNKCAWCPFDGRKLATGGLDGAVTLFHLGDSVSPSADALDLTRHLNAKGLSENE